VNAEQFRQLFILPQGEFNNISCFSTLFESKNRLNSPCGNINSCRNCSAFTPRINSGNQFIKALLGVNAEQFRQLFILPQGEFKRFLLSLLLHHQIIFFEFLQISDC
jgi:hypothetical protein